jgi:DNA helicase II / ATP-dependent DNA helicase PcrA
VEGGLRARLAAARLLSWLEEQDGPQHLVAATNVDRLADLLGLQVALFHPTARREGTFGWLEPGENLIFLRQDLSDPVRRFTLAHEIGHAVLHRAGSDLEKLSGVFAALPSQDLLMPENSHGCEVGDLDTPLVVLATGEEVLRPGEAYSARAERESEANVFAASLLLPEDRLLARYLRSGRQQTAFEGSRRGAITRKLAREFGVSEDVVLRSLAAMLQPGALTAKELAGRPATKIDGPTFGVQLDEGQRQAATAEAPALIIAGPGTGKTSTLVGRVAYLVEEQGISPDAILALTFSNKAAREMRDRLAALLQREEIPSNSLLVPRAMPTVSTIHAFCGDLIRRYAPFVGLRPDFRLISETEGYFLLRQVAADLVLHHYQPLAAPGLHFPALLAAISRAKDELAGPERYMEVARTLEDRAKTPEERIAAERALEVAHVYASYQHQLLARGDADFGDLIRLAVQLLSEQPEILAEVRARYQHVLVDEFQDINRAMGVLLHIVSAQSTSLWAVGDADQAIYRFRGASPANLAQFTTDYPQAQIQSLRRNYRSSRDILVAAASVASAVLGGERAPLEAARGGHDTEGDVAAITLATAPNEQAELAGLAKHIRRHQESGHSLSDQVVLCRTRRQCQRVASALAVAGIPTRTPTPLLEQDDIKDMLSVLSLLGDLSGSGLLRAGNVSDHSFSNQEARAILASARAEHQVPLLTLLQRLDSIEQLTPMGRKGLESLGQIITELRQASDVFTAVARYIFSYTHVGQYLLRQVLQSRESGPSVPSGAEDGVGPAGVAQLLGLARAFEDQQRSLRARAPAISATRSQPVHADWTAFLEYVRVLLVLRQETSGVDEGTVTAGDSVRILTVHASKGLEFPIVYLPGLADRRFPMQRQGNSVPLLPGLSQDELLEAQDPDAHFAEEACLFYVALTRARDEVVLSRADYYGRMRYRPSPFLPPIRQALGERIVTEHWLGATFSHDGPESHATATIRESNAARLPSSVASPIAPFNSPPGPVRHSEVEMYQRCPRQYAYRYVYKLQPREIGLATLRHALQAALYKLQQRLSRSGQRTGRGRAEQFGLPEALKLFESEWTRRLEQERHIQTGDDASASASPLLEPTVVAGDAFLELYRRHGRQVIERAWAQMVTHRSEEPDKESKQLAFDAPDTHFDEQVTVQVRGRELSIVLDRVERGVAAGTSGGGEMGAEPVPSAPMRLVRHRLGTSNPGKPDLHALLYTLAAQKSGAGAPELYSHNLTTGELDQVMLDERKLAKLREELDSVLEGIERGYFPPRPDPAICQSCPFLLVCPA